MPTQLDLSPLLYFFITENYKKSLDRDLNGLGSSLGTCRFLTQCKQIQIQINLTLANRPNHHCQGFFGDSYDVGSLTKVHGLEIMYVHLHRLDLSRSRSRFSRRFRCGSNLRSKLKFLSRYSLLEASNLNYLDLESKFIHI